MKPSVAIRPANESDLGFIIRLSGRVFNIYGDYHGTLMQWFISRRTMTLLALVEGKTVGFVMMGDPSGGELGAGDMEILAIAVCPEVQGRKIGKRLLTRIEREAGQLQIPRLFLHTAVENFTARMLFLKNGYRELGLKKDFYPNGQDAVLMVKELRS